MEELNIGNILEAQEIRNLIRHKKNLLEFFDELIEKVNKKINHPSHLSLEPVFDSDTSDTSDDDELINDFLDGISDR
tara:strand:+ start:1346 stop:1576 length:231 start_codon:yes stop_codon:yes gene_type:complete